MCCRGFYSCESAEFGRMADARRTVVSSSSQGGIAFSKPTPPFFDDADRHNGPRFLFLDIISRPELISAEKHITNRITRKTKAKNRLAAILLSTAMASWRSLESSPACHVGDRRFEPGRGRSICYGDSRLFQSLTTRLPHGDLVVYCEVAQR